MDTPILPRKRIRNKKPSIGGVYQFQQISTGKKYIGSSCDVERRRKDHIRRLVDRKHDNPHLSHAWNMHGGADFVFSVLEIIEDRSQLLTREQWYLDNFIRHGFDFNHCMIAGTPPSPTGRECTEETRKKLSEAHKGKKKSDEAVQKMKKSKLGVKKGPQSQEHRDKIGKARAGKKMTPEQRKRISDAKTGTKTSPETKEKLSKSLKGKKMPPKTPEALANMSKAQIGKKASAETRAKMSMSRKGRKLSPEARANISKAQAGRKYTPEAKASFSRGQYARQAREREERNKKDEQS